jgi:hypothetical protein
MRTSGFSNRLLFTILEMTRHFHFFLRIDRENDEESTQHLCGGTWAIPMSQRQTRTHKSRGTRTCKSTGVTVFCLTAAVHADGPQVSLLLTSCGHSLVIILRSAGRTAARKSFANSARAYLDLCSFLTGPGNVKSFPSGQA